jgi:hypothetical protein
MLRALFALVSVAVATAIASNSRGQETTATSQVVDAISQARENFRPVGAMEVAQAKRELAMAVIDLERWLVRSGPQREAGWKRYFQWDDLENVVAQDGPPSAEVTATLLRKMSAGESGLENHRVVRTRRALSHYADLAATAADTKLQEQFGQRLDDLAKRVDAYQQNPAAGDDAIEISRTLAWLERTGQAPRLRTSLRGRFGRPNLLGSVSERFAAYGVNRDINQLTGVRDNILGTDIHGTAHMTGRTTLAFVDNPRAATMNILLGGAARSRTVGYNGPVTIHSTGYTSLSGVKQLQMTADGLVGYRAGASGRTSTNINDIRANCGLIEKIAWKRAGQQKGQAEAIAGSRAAGRVAGRMDREAGGLIAEQNANYQSRFKQPLIRRNAFPEVLQFSSTGDRAYVEMLQAGGGRLGAPGDAPQPMTEHDVSLRVHESLPVNFGEQALGGVELTDVRLEKLIRDELKAELPEELKVTLPDGTLDPDKEPWSIIFAKELPVRAKFQEGGLWIAIRADGFTRGEGDTPGTYRPAITELVEIAAAYKIEKTDAGATLRRDGDVQVRFPNRENPDQITVRDNATVTFMRRKFRSLFKEEFIGEGLKLKGRWADAGPVPLREIRSEGAWLSLGWSLAEGNPPAAE